MHPQIIPDAAHIVWSKPVEVVFPNGKRCAVKGPCEAVRLLTQEWPTDANTPCEKAKTVCISALHHDQCAEDAREAFVAAVNACDFDQQRRELERLYGEDHDLWPDQPVFHRH